jgi:hypothetical protein
MSDGDKSFSRIGFHVGADWRVYCHAYPDETPIFDIGAGASSVAISIRDRTADESAVEFARSLVREAEKFAAEVERMHAVQLGGAEGTDKAVVSDAA